MRSLRPGLILVVLLTSCVTAPPPVSTLPFVRPPATGHGRVALAAAPVIEHDGATGNTWLYALGTAASLTLRLAPRYTLALEGSSFVVGAEGDLLLLRRPHLRLGLLHGVEGSLSVGSCQGTTCIASGTDLGLAVFGGPLVELDPDDADTFAAALRYAYATDTAGRVTGAHQLLLTLAWSRRLGALRLGPELALGLVFSGGSAPSVLVVPGVSLGADF